MNAVIQHLRQHAKLQNSVDVERFDATLSQIASLNDPRAIGLLLPFFNDECKFPETMFSIIHTIERFDDETYVREILKALPGLWSRSPYWASVLHFRIFNHPPSRQTYRNRLANADAAIKSAAKDLFTTMRSREPKFVEACNEMLTVL
jgi:hypothetical protein